MIEELQARAIFLGKFELEPSFPDKKGIIKAPATGSKTISDNQGNEAWDAADRGMMASMSDW